MNRGGGDVSCPAACVTGCDFDVEGDLCGWEAVAKGDTEWVQWPGAGVEPGVGPEDDFSRPGCESSPNGRGWGSLSKGSVGGGL